MHITSAPAPITISTSVEGRVYSLFALAMGVTALGVYVGMQFAAVLFPFRFILLIAQLAIVFTSQWWAQRSPLNMILFVAFPLSTGITVAPYLLHVTTAYSNGFAIVLNALAATTCMAAAAAVFARTTRWNLDALSRPLVLALLGLLGLMVLQVFIPGLRTQFMELLISGAGVVLFAVYTSVSIQRIQNLSRFGASPFLLALSLYLDIYNLFLFVLRFMLTLSGQRRE